MRTPFTLLTNGGGAVASLATAFGTPTNGARLELTRVEAAGPGDTDTIEAQLPAQQFRELGLTEGETVLLNLRKARVFVQAPH